VSLTTATLPTFETLTIRREGGVVLGSFVSSLAHQIASFPAAGHVSVRDRVNAIALPPVEEFRRDSDLFGEGVRACDARRRITEAMKHGLQTRAAELALAPLLGDLAGR